MPVLRLVEERSDEVEDTVYHVRYMPTGSKLRLNLRADDRRDERSPRQTAVRLARDGLTGRTKAGSV